MDHDSSDGEGRNVTIVVNLRKQRYDIYIGRAGKGQDGYFGNPISKNEPCFVCNGTHSTPESTLHCFEAYFHHRLEIDEEFKSRVLALKGKTLGCFCKPRACHGDIIARYVEQHA